MPALPIRRGATVCALALLVAGCSGDDSTGVGDDDRLTANDAGTIAAFIAGQPVVPGAGTASLPGYYRVRGLALVGGSAVLGVASRLRPSLAQVSAGPFNINQTVNCPGGGSIAISGSGNRAPHQQARETVVTWAPANSFTNCVFGSGTNSITLTGTLTGNGTMTWRWPAQMGGTPTMATFAVSRTGTLNLSKGANSQSCSVSLTTSGQGDQFQTTGTICEHQVSTTQRPPGLQN